MIKHPAYPNGNIYLSGGMQHASDLGAGWRQSCGSALKRMGYYPLDIAELDIAYREAHGDLYRFLTEEELLERKSNIRKHFIYTDLQLIERDSDALIVLYDESARLGAGTISECQVAYNFDLPLFLVNGYSKLDDVPGWLQALSTKIFANFESLYEYLEELPAGVLKRDIYGNHHGGQHYLCSLCGLPFIKGKTHFVSKVSPLYCKSCVEIVKATHEQHYDRYQFFVEYLEQQVELEQLKQVHKEVTSRSKKAVEDATRVAEKQFAFLKEKK